MSTEDIDGLDDVENSLLHYNQAIIHYHMRQYSEAIFIGERLYQFLEPFGTLSSLHEFELLLQTYFKNNPGVSSYERLVSCDSIEFEYDVMSLGFFCLFFLLEEKFAQAVCFLLVDLYLLTFQPEKALHLLAVLDKLSAQGSNKNNKGEVRRGPSEEYMY